jgi:uncharacterized membrane protein HdeD (DUF308 family)
MLVTNPLSRPSWASDTVKSLTSGWWVLVVTGIVSVVAGGLIVVIDWSVADLAVFLGFLFIVRGIFTTFSLPIDGSARTLSVVVGLCEVAIGVAVLVWPDPTLLVIAAFIGWWLLFGGVMTIVGSIGLRRLLPYWGLYLAVGIVESALAVYLLGRPGLTLVATVLAIGFWSIFYGIAQIAMGIEIKHLPDRFDDLEHELRTRLSEPLASSARSS